MKMNRKEALRRATNEISAVGKRVHDLAKVLNDMSYRLANLTEYVAQLERENEK